MYAWAHEGKPFPVGYPSEKFSDRERKFCTIENECLAVVGGGGGLESS